MSDGVVGLADVERAEGDDLGLAEDCPLGVLADRGRGHRQVGGRVDQGLVTDHRFAGGRPQVPQLLGDDRRQVAPGGVAAQADAAPVDPVVGVLVEPADDVDRVMARRRCPVLGCHAVVDAHDDGVELGRQVRAQRVVHPGRPLHPATTVEVDEEGAVLPSSGRCVPAKGDARAVADRRAPVVGRHVRVHPPRDPGEGRRRRVHLGAGRTDVLERGVDDRDPTDVVEECREGRDERGQAGVGTLHDRSPCRWWATSPMSSSSAGWAAGASPGKVW